MAKFFFGILLSLVLMVSIAYAADWHSVYEEMKAKHGDFDNQFQDMVLVEEVTMAMGSDGQMMSTTSKSFRKGKKLRTESMIRIPNMPEGMDNNMQSVMIDDDKDVWSISSFGGMKKLSGKEEEQHQMHDDWQDLFSDKATIVATEVVDGRECYVVEFDKDVATGIKYAKLWLDTADLVPVKAEGKDEVKGDQSMIFLWSDYRKIKDSDRKMPHITQMFLNGKLMMTTIIKSIEVNKGISDDLFDPAKVKIEGPNMQDMMKKMMQQKSGD